MIGDFLYQLTPRDEQVTPLDLLYQTVGNTAVSTSLGASFFTLANRALLLQGLTCIAEGAGAALVQRLQVTLQRAAPFTPITIFEFFHRFVPAGVASMDFQIYPAHLVIAPNHVIVVAVTLSAAVAGNNVNLNVAGINIPRGNLSLGQL